MADRAISKRIAATLDRRLPHRVRLMHLQALYWSTILIQTRLPGMRGSYIVLGYVGSGTNWLCNLLSETLGIPVFEHWKRLTPSLAPQIFHLHRFIETRETAKRTIYMHRDGRDAVISVFHKYLNALHESRPRQSFERHLGAKMDAKRIREQFPAFLEWFTQTDQLASAPWPIHVRRALDLGYPRLSFEALKADSESALAKAIEALTGHAVAHDRVAAALAAHAFERRKSTDNAHFMRKGQSGEWRDVYNRRSREIFAEWAGAELIALGYETDDLWINAG